MHGYDMYDYGARGMYPAIMRFTTPDPLAEKKPWISPYVYCSDNPVNRIDIEGNWDVTVHLAKDRSQNGYGIVIVTDKKGNEVFRFNVRAEGIGGRNRMNQNADTPLGIYDIPNELPWLKGGNRASFGPNYRLNMVGESGEIIESGRNNIRIHGGRQEIYETETGKWTPVTNPKLSKTGGCLRAYEADMILFKDITDNLQKNDTEEIPGKVTITDDLDKLGTSTKAESIKGVKVQYFVPALQLKYWEYLINSIFKKEK